MKHSVESTTGEFPTVFPSLFCTARSFPPFLPLVTWSSAPPFHQLPSHSFLCRFTMFSQLTKQQTTGLWMWRMEYEHHEQRPLYFGEWF